MEIHREIVNVETLVIKMEFAQINVRKGQEGVCLAMEMVVDKAIALQVSFATKIVLAPTDVLDWHSMV